MNLPKRKKILAAGCLLLSFSVFAEDPFSLDVDANGTTDALTDGIIIIRYLFGFTGGVLTDSAIGPGATRTDPTEIVQYLNGGGNSLDIDDNGTTDALTDGILIIRYLFGFTGDALIANAVAPGANRTGAAEIEAHLLMLDSDP